MINTILTMHGTIEESVERIVRGIGNEVDRRAVMASNELTSAVQLSLTGQRSGKKYIIPGTGRVKYNKKDMTASVSYKKYTASAPGESPAVRTGAFRAGWQRKYEIVRRNGYDRDIYFKTENRQKANGYLLGELLEDGSPGGQLAPRPYVEKTLKAATPKIKRIYSANYGGRL